MNTLYFLWATAHSAYLALGRNADRQEQHAVEAYLSRSQSVAELEYRERQWMRARS